MRKFLNRKISFVFATALCACGLQACWVDSNHCETRSRCHLTCPQYCDFWGCYSDCHEVCDTVCVEPPECHFDIDCGANSACINGQCFSYGATDIPPAHPDQPSKPSTTRGDVPMCGACNRNVDCYEENAACTALESGEQVCTRTCNTVEDCPTGFTCSVVTDFNNNQSVNQCLPVKMSCDNSYCRSAADCQENATCENNRCVLAMNKLSECQTYEDCKDYKTQVDGATLNTCVFYKNNNGQEANYCTIDCYGDNQCDSGYSCHLTRGKDSKDKDGNTLFALDSGVCFRDTEIGCYSNNECEDGMICRNGRCAVTCQRDSDCQSTAGNFRCLNKACVYQH